MNQTATIDVFLAPGAQTEVISVEATTEQLQVSSAELGTVIATKQVNDLPLNGRNFTQLLSLTPGVSPISVSQNNMGGRTGGFAAPIAEGAAFSFPSINGATNRSNYFLTDGMNNFAAFLSTYAVPPIVDAIQEFKVVSHTDSSEFGSVLGGVVNVAENDGQLAGIFRSATAHSTPAGSFYPPTNPSRYSTRTSSAVQSAVPFPFVGSSRTRSSILRTKASATRNRSARTFWFRQRPS